jgi:hypothetical protein
MTDPVTASPSPSSALGVHLVRTAERVEEIDLLAERLGGRVGLSGVLADLNRAARPGAVPGLAVRWGFRWDEEDHRSRRWWPQGITTSGDAHDEDLVDGRAVVVTSAYSKTVDGYSKGARLSIVDVTDRTAVRYRHVLLVEPYVDQGGRVDVRPLHVHAGGIVWHGDHLHVAGTRRGIATFRLDDVLRVPTGGDPSRLEIERDEVHAFGYRYVLPARFGYEAVTDEGLEQLRYSFLSLDRSTSPHELVAGEYGRGSMTTRLVRYEVDPATSLLRTDEAGTSRPLALDERGIGHMQGATVVGGRWYVTTSAGRYLLGSVWTGTPGDLRRSRFAIPVGPEDITYWPSRDELWSLSEYPGHRYVFAMNRAYFG